MLGRKREQMELLLFSPEEMIPQNRLLKKIDRIVSFDWFCGFEISDKIPDHLSFTQN